MKRFDPDERRLFVREDHSVVISANDVGWVLRVPGPNAAVPTDITTELLCHFKRKFGNYNGVEEKAVFELMLGSSVPEIEFKQLFLLYALGVLLCPTQSSKISPMHLKVLHAAAEAQKYNWCQYVLDWLVGCSRRFKSSQSKCGGYGGCAIFFMIFYIDRINIGNPVNWMEHQF